MNSQVVRLKKLSLVSVVLFVVVATVWESNNAIREELHAVEELFFASRLILSRESVEAHVISTEPVFDKEWGDGWRNWSPKPTISNLLLRLDSGKYAFGGTLLLGTGELVQFTRHASVSGERARLREGLKRDLVISPGFVTKNTILEFQFYEVDSKSFPGHTHNLTLAKRIQRQEDYSTWGPSQWALFDMRQVSHRQAGQLESEVLRRAEPWVGAVSSPENAYLSMRAEISQQTVRVPVLNIDANASKVVLFFSILALSLAVLIAHCSIAIFDSLGGSRLTEPWLLVVVGSAKRPNVGPLKRLFSIAGLASYVVVFLLPCGTLSFCLALSDSTGVLVLLTIILAIAIILSAVSILHLWKLSLKIHEACQ